MFIIVVLVKINSNSNGNSNSNNKNEFLKCNKFAVPLKSIDWCNVIGFIFEMKYLMHTMCIR